MKTIMNFIKSNSLQTLPFLAVLTLAMFPDLAFAAPWDDALDGILDNLNSGFMRSLAIFACIGLGIAWYFGKISLKWAAGIVGGIVCTFGSAAIVDLVIGWIS